MSKGKVINFMKNIGISGSKWVRSGYCGKSLYLIVMQLLRNEVEKSGNSIIYRNALTVKDLQTKWVKIQSLTYKYTNTHAYKIPYTVQPFNRINLTHLFYYLLTINKIHYLLAIPTFTHIFYNLLTIN